MKHTSQQITAINKIFLAIKSYARVLEEDGETKEAKDTLSMLGSEYSEYFDVCWCPECQEVFAHEDCRKIGCEDIEMCLECAEAEEEKWEAEYAADVRRGEKL